MINTIIFSKDRCSQLHLLLESIERSGYHESPLFAKFSVIYNYSDDSFKEGYEKLINFFPDINFIEETDFDTDLKEAIDEFCDFTMFLTDDNVLYNPSYLKNVYELLESHLKTQLVTTISLRLGINTVHCYTQAKENKYSHLLNYDIDDTEFFIVKIKDAVNDYAYPYSVDAHIFNTSHILELTNKIQDCKNPNIYEAYLQQFLTGEEKIMFPKESVFVNMPINRVQNTFNNHSGLKHGKTQEYLNEMYLEDIIIDFDRLDFSSIKGCHQELEIKFKPIEMNE